MRTIRFVALVLAIFCGAPAVAGVPFQTIEAAPGKVLQSRCHMGECAWTKIVSSRTQVRPSRDLVVEVVQDTGASLMDGPDAGKIEWMGEVKSRATCSYNRPAVSFYTGGEWTEHALNLSPQGTVFGYQVGSVITYFLACHNLAIDESGIDAAIERFGYDVIAEE